MDLVYIHPKHHRSKRKFSLRHGLLRFDPINPNRRGWIEVRDWGFGYGWTIHLAWLSITFGDLDGCKFAGDCDLDRAIPFYGYLKECWIPTVSQDSSRLIFWVLALWHGFWNSVAIAAAIKFFGTPGSFLVGGILGFLIVFVLIGIFRDK